MSLLDQQLRSAVASGSPFLGLPVIKVPAHYISAENDADELRCRQRSINQLMGIPIQVAPSRLSSLVGNPNIELGTYDERGRLRLSRVFLAIVERAFEVATVPIYSRSAFVRQIVVGVFWFHRRECLPGRPRAILMP